MNLPVINEFWQLKREWSVHLLLNLVDVITCNNVIIRNISSAKFKNQSTDTLKLRSPKILEDIWKNNNLRLNKLQLKISEPHSEASQIPKMEFFIKIVKNWNSLTILGKSSLLDFWQSSLFPWNFQKFLKDLYQVESMTPFCLGQINSQKAERNQLHWLIKLLWKSKKLQRN